MQNLNYLHDNADHFYSTMKHHGEAGDHVRFARGINEARALIQKMARVLMQIGNMPTSEEGVHTDDFGLEYDEVLEMAYDNIIHDVRGVMDEIPELFAKEALTDG